MLNNIQVWTDTRFSDLNMLSYLFLAAQRKYAVCVQYIQITGLLLVLSLDRQNKIEIYFSWTHLICTFGFIFFGWSVKTQSVSAAESWSWISQWSQNVDLFIHESLQFVSQWDLDFSKLLVLTKIKQVWLFVSGAPSPFQLLFASPCRTFLVSFVEIRLAFDEITHCWSMK